MTICPVCASGSLLTIVSAEQLQQECRVREKFVGNRLSRPATEEELKDLTDFFHSETAHLVACSNCGLLIRREHEAPAAERYSKDEYDPEVIENVYPQYLEAFRAKQQTYRALLQPGARVVEIGSHYGAFLQTATEWGWKAEGVDVGEDTTRFARSKGLTVHHAALEDCRFASASFDAVFIWNCYEQIGDPKRTLAESRRLLKPGGLLVVRTPSGLFYSTCQQLLRDPTLRADAKEFLLGSMAYNNLLGFPYLYGHSPATLVRQIEPFGFRKEGFVNSELLTLPLPEQPEWVEREERVINEGTRLLANWVLADGAGSISGPWIEVWFRAA
jgi:SAM-dependent methyltransferase